MLANLQHQPGLVTGFGTVDGTMRYVARMIEVTATAEIDRPTDQVFEYIADMANNPVWQKGMQSCEWTSAGELAVGSTYDQVATFLGKEIRTGFVVTELEPGARIRIESTSGPMPLDITRSVAFDGGAGSVVKAVIRGDSSGVFRIAAPVMRWMVNRSVQADYRRLKETLEG